MEAIAKTRHLKGSPRKARLVIDLIRGRNVSQALAILRFTDKRAANPIAKCLRSAIANATNLAEQQNIAIDPDDLWVKTCFVDMGVHKNRRRMRPAPQGRAFREQRHYCHLTILVSSDDKPEKNKKNLKARTKNSDSGKTDVIETKAKTSAKTKTVKKTENKGEVKTEKKTKKAKEETSQPEAEATKNTKTAKPKVEREQKVENESADVLETNSPKASEGKGTAEAPNAKDLSSQTAEVKDETKQANEAGLGEDNILDL
jgi:large subunit ribosomal protein L22